MDVLSARGLKVGRGRRIVLTGGERPPQAEMATTAAGGPGGRAVIELLLVLLVAPAPAAPFIAYPPALHAAVAFAVAAPWSRRA
ncbi:hypothetical protein [Candidatus Solirubrobacter pratensis]|uniref:hypothetical protein n=1 Tax=Candidatus Solirubrobacter pratensis TaxID=1298857 RepID=UPI00040BF840|nr:hypothetical protein [Candidatus Solirubrobacter pratensis]